MAILRTFRDAFLPFVDGMRGFPPRWGLRLHSVTVIQRIWSGARVGIGTSTDFANSLKNDLGTYPVKVRNVSQRDIVASGGFYTDQDVIVGPITPAFAGSGSDNDAISAFELAVNGNPTEVLFRITGPGYPATGAYFAKIQTRVDKPFRYELILRKTGELP